MKRLVLIALLAAACGSPTNPTAAVLAETNAPQNPARPSANVCAVAISHLESFAQRMADDLVSVRPVVVATSFDLYETIRVSRRVSADLTAYHGLEETLRQCDATSDLASRLELLRLSAEWALEVVLSASIPDAQAHRDAAVTLFALLPEVLALSEAGARAASSLEMSLEIAQISEGADEPISVLPPLATPTPRPTPKPTKRPATGVGTGGGSGSKSSGWATAARAYVNSAFGTYNSVTVNALELYGYEVGPGMTEEEIAALRHEANLYRKPAVRAINRHLGYMNSHSARSCYRDAYAADRSLAKRWLTLLQSGNYPGTVTPQARQATIAWDDARSRTRTFLNKMSRYLSDCP